MLLCDFLKNTIFFCKKSFFEILFLKKYGLQLNVIKINKKNFEKNCAIKINQILYICKYFQNIIRSQKI